MNGKGRIWTFSRATKPRGRRRPLGKMSEADVTPAKIAPVSRISAAVRAEDRRKAEKVRASAVFSALGDGAWVSQTQEVAMAVEEEVVVKAEEAPVSFKGSVRFEIKTTRAAPTRPALDCFRDLEDRVEEAPVRAPVARPKPAAPVEVVEPPVIDCAGSVPASPDRECHTAQRHRRVRTTDRGDARWWVLSPPPRHPRHRRDFGRRRRDPATQAATAAGSPSRTRSRRASSSRRPRNSCAAPSCYEAAVLR